MSLAAFRGAARRVSREPLVHFLAIGAVICLLPGVLGTAAPRDAATVVISRADVDRLAEQWSRTWQRPPTADELRELIDGHVRQEILCREAAARGLDRNDEIIRRRLVEKMQLLAAGDAEAADPTDDELAAWLAAHADAFRRPARVSLTQVWLDPRVRGDRAAGDARQLLHRLDAGEKLDPAELGDGGSADAGQVWLDDVTAGELQRLFGARFAETVMSLDPGRWAGPIESERGLHLVLVRDATPSYLPDLGVIRESVRRDWLAARRQAVDDEMYRTVRQRYRVIVEPAAEPR